VPDYGLGEALASALKTLGKGADFTRAPEAEAAAQAAKRAAPDAGVAAGAQSPAAPAASPAAPEPVNPDMPDLSAQNPKPAAPAPVDTSPSPPADAGTGAPAVTPPVGDLEPQAEPLGKPGQTPVEAAGTPPATDPVPEPIPPRPAPQSPLEAAVTTDAQRFVTANMSDFEGKLNLEHMPNTDTMASPDSMKAAILQVADDNKGAILDAKRGTIGNEQLLGLAQDLALSTDVVGTVLKRQLGTQFTSPETVLAARLVEQNLLGTLQAGPADKILTGAATSADILEYARQKQQFVDYHTQLAGGVSEQGRGLNAASIPAPGTLPPAVMDHIAQVIRQNNPNLDQEVTAIKLAQTPVGLANIMLGSLPKRIALAARSMITRIFVNGVLSGPPTWAKILIGNNYNLAVNAFDIVNAGMIRGATGLAGRIGRFPTSAEGADLADAYTYVHGVISGTSDGLRLMGRTMKTGVSMDGLLRFDPSDVSGINNVNPKLGTTQSVLPELQGTYLGSFAKVLDTVIDAPGSRVIGGVDELTKTMGARGYRTMMVMKEIRSQLLDGTLKPGDEGVVAKQMFENPSPEMLQAEEDWAHRQTFQSPFPEGGPGQAFSNFITTQAPALKFIFPFMKTATNILKQSAVERTPLALFSSRIRNSLAAGGMEADLAKGRIASGTAITSMLGWLAVHDRITGDAPKDPAERALWDAEGRQPLSIKVTNPVTGQEEWRSYAWLEPIATVAGITANAARVFSHVHQDEEIDTLKPHAEMLGDAITNVGASVITNIGDKTLMTGAAKFAEMFADPQKGFQMWAQDTATSMVPYSKAIEFSRNLQDPYLRDAQNLLDKIENDLPGQSQKLGVRVDYFGQPRVGRGGNSILGPMSPFPSSPVKQDDVTDELESVMNATHDVPMKMPSKYIALPQSGSGKGILGGAGLPLTSQEYSELVQKSRAEPVPGWGLNLHDKLAQVMQTGLYQGATAPERAAIISQYQEDADRAGRARLYNENDDFKQRLIAWAADKNRIRTQQ